MHRDSFFHEYWLSDHAFRMLWYGLIESTITQTDVCDFHMVFHPYPVIHAARVHEGTAFIGPDGLALRIRGQYYDGGDASVAHSPLTTSAAVLAHANYQTWIANLLWRGDEPYSSDYHQKVMNHSIRLGNPLSNTKKGTLASQSC